MTFTYDPTLATDRDRVRFLLGDRDATDPHMTDEEIEATLVVTPDPLMAASQCCQALAASYAFLVNQRQEELAVNYSDLFEHFTRLAETLRIRALASGTIGPWAGGISRTERDMRDTDLDRVGAAIRRARTVQQDDA